MSNKNPFESFDEQLREQFDQFQPEMPDGVWEAMESALDSMNADLNFDQAIREGMEQLQVTPPHGVFEAIQAQLPATAGVGYGMGVVGKWVVGSLLAGGIVTAAWLGFGENDKPTGSSETPTSIEETYKPEPIVAADSQNSDQAIAISTEGSEPQTFNPNASVNYKGHGRENGKAVVSPTSDEGAVTPNSGTPQANVAPAPSNPTVPFKPNPEFTKPVFCFSASDTNLCLNQVYRLFLYNADNCRYDVWVDNAVFARNVEGAKVVEIPMESEGVRTVEITARKGGKTWNKQQILYVEKMPAAGLTRIDVGNGKYAFDCVCENLQVRWYMDGVFHSKEKVAFYQFYDPQPRDHQMLAITTTAKGCSDTARIEFRNNVVFEVKAPTIPGSFSPNGDGVNDAYMVDVEGTTYYHIRIYNRNKQLVYESFDPKAGWDGKDKFRGGGVYEDEYTCFVEYALAGGEKHTVTKSVRLFVK